MMYDTEEEMFAVLGNPEENEFIVSLEEETAAFTSAADELLHTLL
jgi:hypothetical protein